MTRPIPLIVAAFFTLLFSCATHTALHQTRPIESVPAEVRSRIEKEVAQKIKADDEAFNLLSVKMDEYQDMLAICERLSETDENSSLRTACTEKLKAVRRELEELSGLLQGQQ
jgi:hypothetical protein